MSCWFHTLNFFIDMLHGHESDGLRRQGVSFESCRYLGHVFIHVEAKRITGNLKLACMRGDKFLHNKRLEKNACIHGIFRPPNLEKLDLGLLVRRQCWAWRVSRLQARRAGCRRSVQKHRNLGMRSTPERRRRICGRNQNGIFWRLVSKLLYNIIQWLTLISANFLAGRETTNIRATYVIFLRGPEVSSDMTSDIWLPFQESFLSSFRSIEATESVWLFIFIKDLDAAMLEEKSTQPCYVSVRGNNIFPTSQTEPDK